jgi:ATP-binding cassette subfamily B protein
LITGLYPATEGQILYGDTPIQDLEPEAFRNLMSVVFQDFGKYHFTAGENIHIGDASREYIMAEVEQAAVRSGANLYIDQFALGYDTQMGKLFEDGQEISIGQWQKLALARALYRDAHFIILDEATSAIDSLAENELISLLQQQMGDKGIILISHRLSVIKHADYIYVLSGGEMVQEGTHQDLVQEKGPYYHQFKNDLEPL